MEIKTLKHTFLLYGINLFIASLIVIIIAGLPFAISSIYSEVVSNSSDADKFILIESDRTDDFTHVEILSKELDPINQTINLKVFGYRNCDAKCDIKQLKLHISNFYYKDSNENRIPESFIINIPADGSEFEEDIILPINGVVYEYPYDRYSMLTAIALESIVKGVSTYAKTDDNRIRILLDEQTSRLQDTEHRIIPDLRKIMTEHPPVIAFASNYERPFYVKYIVTLLVILLIITTTATIFLSDFSKLITGSAGIIIGVWGTRSLLLGNLPPDVTLIDIVLTMIVIGTLICVAIKSALYARKHIKRD